MNKYSKRALKTTATVGMSLAMVLSAAAPVMAVTGNGLADSFCATIDQTTADCGELLYIKLYDKNVADYTMEGKDITLTDTTNKKTDYFTAIKELNDGLDAFFTAASTTEKINFKKWSDAATAIDGMFTDSLTLANEAKTTNDTDTGVVTFAGKVKTARDNMAKTGAVAADSATTWTKEGFASKTAGTTLVTGEVGKANLAAAKAALKDMNDFVKNGYDLNMTAVMQDVFAEVRSNLEDVINDFTGDTKPADLAAFVVNWEMLLNFDLANKEGATIDADYDGNITGITKPVGKINLSSKSQLNGRIKAIKDNDFYASFKDEDSVIAIIEAYEELIANIDGNKDLTKSDSYKAYVTEKTADANKTAKAAINDFVAKAVAATPSADTAAKKADAIATDIDNEQFEALKAYKEDVLDEVLTMGTRKIGNYHIAEVTESKTVSLTVRKNVKDNLPASIYTLVDTEDGLFGYDVIEKHMNEFNSALNAATKDIEKITPANIKASDRTKLEAAEDAIYELTQDKGDYVKNLTDKEERNLRAADRKIENLREAFDNLGTTTATGWYDKGNGNWGYNNEDGTAATKWVAAGSDWYYVKGGNMLRNAWVAQDATGAKWYYVDNAGKMVSNTTIDGFVIDANGVWTK